MEQRKKTRVAIVVLAVLLALSLAALGATLVHNRLAPRFESTTTVPDNLITPGKTTTAGVTGTANASAAGAATTTPVTARPQASWNATTAAANRLTESADSSDSSAISTVSSTVSPSAASASEGTTSQDAQKTATTIELYSNQPQVNEAFQASNIFPGDAETKYYCVRVSYHNAVTVHFAATPRPGYEMLGEVLNIRVNLLTSGEVLYDGPINSMPASVTHKLASAQSTTDELYYEITAYLDTSVGNEYQNKDLAADFSWWIEETGNLDSSPKTGDATHVLLWALVAAASGCALIALLFARKRKENNEDA